MQPMVNIALRAARRAGQIIVRAMDRIETLSVEGFFLFFYQCFPLDICLPRWQRTVVPRGVSQIA